jgi:hypothetical protein
MSTNVKTYSVSKVKQLIDLNGDSTNFDISFRVTSKNSAPFDILVVDQATLDGNPDLKYKNVSNGSISGRIKHDKNIYQNHFMILKSENACECNVEIQKTDLPKNIPQSPAVPVPSTTPQVRTIEVKQDSFRWIKIVLILGLIIGIGFALYWFSQKRDKEGEGGEVKLYTPPQSPSHGSPVPTGKNLLLERLKGLNMSN